MNYRKSCPHCGHVTTAYTINFNEGLASAFVQFARMRNKLGWAVAKSELALSHSQYGNFQKLRHFGLIEKREGQRWEMTAVGWSFLNGSVEVLNPAGQFGNATLAADHPAWSTHEQPRTRVAIRQVLPDYWKQYTEYAAEKAGAA